jgi:osmotically-inducible protein OsmY
MRILVIWLVGIILSGCSGRMMSGASSGSPVEENGPSQSQQAADSAITARVKSRYAEDSLVSLFDIDVRTSGAKVTLSGTVASYAAREEAEKLAISTDGVKAVDNQINVKYSK